MVLTRLSCGSCSTELSGEFDTCDFCSLGAEDRQTLRVFLASRGNIKDLERHLGVSYPTARARLDGVLAKLNIDRPEEATERLDVLQLLATGQINVDEAAERLR